MCSAMVDVDVEERVCLSDGDGEAHNTSDAPLIPSKGLCLGWKMVSSDLDAFI